MSQLQQKRNHRIVSYYTLKSQSALRELKKELAKHKVLKLSKGITEAFGQLTRKAGLFVSENRHRSASLKISLPIERDTRSRNTGCLAASKCSQWRSCGGWLMHREGLYPLSSTHRSAV